MSIELRLGGFVRLAGALGAVALSAAHCDETGPRDAVRIAWSVALQNGGGWQGRPGLADGVAVLEDGPTLLALDLATGAQRWRTQLRQGIAINAQGIAVAQGIAFTAGGDSVYAVSMSNGSRLWAFLPESQAALCEPSADGSAVYVGTRNHRVYALAAQTGAVLWSVDVGPAWQFTGIVVGTAVSGDTVYVSTVQYLNSSGGLRAGHVTALDRRSGALLWDYVTGGDRSDVLGSPGVADGLLVVGDAFGRGFFALHRSTGQEAWRVTTQVSFAGVSSTPVTREGRVYAGAQGGVYVAELTSGNIVWKREDLFARDVAICNGLLLAQGQEIVVLNLADGRSVATPLINGDQEFPTSRFAAYGRDVVVVGISRAYGIRC